jgi:hypothetical protein
MTPREIAQLLGRRGGRVRACRLSAAERARIASMGGRARLESIRAARRITENFRYAASLRSLRERSPDVTPLRAFKGPLPGIYPAKT